MTSRWNFSGDSDGKSVTPGRDGPDLEYNITSVIFVQVCVWFVFGPVKSDTFHVIYIMKMQAYYALSLTALTCFMLSYDNPTHKIENDILIYVEGQVYISRWTATSYKLSHYLFRRRYRYVFTLLTMDIFLEIWNYRLIKQNANLILII